MGKSGVAEGDMLVTLCLRNEDIDQARKALVDTLRLLQALASGARAVEALGAREVHKVECAIELAVVPPVQPRQVEGEDVVRPRGVLIHQRRTHGALLGGLGHEHLHVTYGAHLNGLDVWHDGAPDLVVHDCVLWLRAARSATPFPTSAQQVMQLLVVDLQKGRLHGDRPTRLAHVLRLQEDATQGAGDDTLAVLLRTLHGVSLSRAGLAIGEDADLVAIQGRLHQVRDFVEDGDLVVARAEDLVKHKIATSCPVIANDMDTVGPCRSRLD
mmetsp:Transcript_69624/g.154092  ORF Transcript_69624/g.154092 Transcript_69624/m.154092 type:complete len:271 (-) Transcript_69624:623-1435(-)